MKNYQEQITDLFVWTRITFRKVSIRQGFIFFFEVTFIGLPGFASYEFGNPKR